MFHFVFRGVDLFPVMDYHFPRKLYFPDYYIPLPCSPGWKRSSSFDTMESTDSSVDLILLFALALQRTEAGITLLSLVCPWIHAWIWRRHWNPIPKG